METLRPESLRILAVDDDSTTLELYHQILCAEGPRGMESHWKEIVAKLFPEDVSPDVVPSFELTLCQQGEHAVEAVREAVEMGQPFAVSFIDVHLPPGPDGIWTAEQIRSIDPLLEIVIVTGFADVDPIEISHRVPPIGKLLYFRKPFYPQEVQQFSLALSAKWYAERQLRNIQEELETRVQERTAELSRVNQQLKEEMAERIQGEKDLDRLNEKLRKEHKQRELLSRRIINLLENDRHQTAMELHDHVGQILTTMKMDLEIVQDKLDVSFTELRERISNAKEKASQAISDLKNIAYGLKPEMLYNLGLVPSLRALFDDMKRNTDLEISFFTLDLPEKMDKEKELAIYRIAQESLTNIVKHARAKNVFVNLVKKNNYLSLSVEDDGVGFEPNEKMKITKGKGGLGLNIMRERVMHLSGEFSMESQEGKGTLVLVEIPL